MTSDQSYRFGFRYLALFAVDMLIGRHHSFARDGERLLARLERPPAVQGEEHIPTEGALVLAVNHYQRRGLWVGWGALAVSTAVARRRGEDLRWVMAGEFRGRLLGPIPWPAPLLRWVFRRIADTCGHILMPAADNASSGRARSVREILRTLRGGGVVGMLPEARNSPGAALRTPEPEVGRLLAEMGRQGAKVLPVAVREEDGALRVDFGPPISPSAGRSEETAARALSEVMRGIARLLPPAMRGAYGSTQEARRRPLATAPEGSER